MKMKLWDRLILRLGALITLLTSVLAIINGVRLLDDRIPEGRWQLWLRLMPYALIIAGGLTVAISLYNLVLPRRYTVRRRAFVTQPTEHGELRIAVNAIENLILKCVETHKEVKVLSMQICNRRGAVNVDLRVSMNSNISIPHAVEQLQTQIKRYLAASSGIEVREISVSVERATGDESALPSEPLPKATEMETAEPAEKTEKVEKVSMHQRVFGRDTNKTVAEQVVEAEAVMPPAEDAPPAAQVEAEAAAPAEEIAEKEEAAQDVQMETAQETAAQAEEASERDEDTTEAQA